MVKAVLFDYGGVMTDGGRGGEVVPRLAAMLQIDETAAATVFESVWSDFAHGTIDESTLWQRIEKTAGRSIAAEQRSIWNAWPAMKPHRQMVDMVMDLRQRGLTVGLLSNTIPVTSRAILEHGGYEGFAPCILSYEIGLAKPEPAIYAYAEAKLPGIKPAEILFIDDQVRCLEPARQRGWHTIHAQTTDQIIKDVYASIS